ncbi:hypothetical protein N7520_002855 [Penicillium odoratum]|uniref:uncharacterized protein n=1 Tax=Penicillium odoratum TaxID=1167516 RepID=UPI002547FFCF|nr:uncharacterized protein N7520_002855 [Penicillium odoratum]KAJ5772326.1 hypothetical protein N7520_002855 [Penicillium odoratum]
MFYSHEILTSPEHGVATIWLVATLGSRSITRRLNRKAILDVDVPGACNVIVNPEAPMALRLQGNLLFGVSRVYHEQCGYTLLDAQSMHDKMISSLKVLPGGGLDPFAGKTKPSTLVLPYDPNFFPETNLPGLNIDFNMLDLMPDDSSSQWSGLWSRSPAGSRSSASRMSVHLQLGSDDLLEDGTIMFGEAARKHGLPMKTGRDRLGDEEGVLLQPDFEFNENGEIVEFDASHLSPRKRRKYNVVEGEKNKGLSGDQTGEMDVAEEITIRDDGTMVIDTHTSHHKTMLSVEHGLNLSRPVEHEEIEPIVERQARQYNRVVRPIDPDDSTTLRNTDLARWNNEYSQNMALASKQKQQNKLQTAVKKNAAFWVFGQGIGSVGIGIGSQREDHPLKCFSGEELYDALHSNTNQLVAQKDLRKPESDTDTETDTEKQRRGSPGKGMNSVDIEIGRHAPPSLMDEHSSQMPWNMTSVQSSRLGRLESMSELSAKFPDSRGTRRGRLTSASPLAGRGYRDSISALGDFDVLDEDLEISRYLEAELATDKEDITTLSRRASASAFQRVVAQLDQESVNFFDYIQVVMGANGGKEVAFSELLPHVKTSRAVATQGLMNVLTLGTKGVLTVWQEPFQVEGVEGWGATYDYGEIIMRMK